MKQKLLISILPLTASICSATITITNVSETYSENFAGLLDINDNDAWTDNSTVAGWYADQSAMRTDGAGNGLNAFSDGVDHALGSRAGGAAFPQVIYGAGFVNGTGVTLTDVSISFLQEQYYAGVAGEVVDFQYFVGDASNVSDSVAWVDLVIGNSISAVWFGRVRLLLN